MKWVKERWSDEARTVLLSALCDDESWIRAEVDSGNADLYRVENHGFIITRLEQINNHYELVLVAWAGKNTGPIIDYVKRYCLLKGVKSIRFHTRHAPKVVARMVKKWGFSPVETVFKWVA